MSLEVRPSDDGDRPMVFVHTEDATGQVRTYQIELGPETLDGSKVMGGKRVDEDAPDDKWSASPSQMAWDAAREHFRSEGHEVHE